MTTKELVTRELAEKFGAHKPGECDHFDCWMANTIMALYGRLARCSTLLRDGDGLSSALREDRNDKMQKYETALECIDRLRNGWIASCYEGEMRWEIGHPWRVEPMTPEQAAVMGAQDVNLD